MQNRECVGALRHCIEFVEELHESENDTMRQCASNVIENAGAVVKLSDDLVHFIIDKFVVEREIHAISKINWYCANSRFTSRKTQAKDLIKVTFNIYFNIRNYCEKIHITTKLKPQNCVEIEIIVLFISRYP